jgi:hypothetical protein
MERGGQVQLCASGKAARWRKVHVKGRDICKIPHVRITFLAHRSPMDKPIISLVEGFLTIKYDLKNRVIASALR